MSTRTHGRITFTINGETFEAAGDFDLAQADRQNRIERYNTSASAVITGTIIDGTERMERWFEAIAREWVFLQTALHALALTADPDAECELCALLIAIDFDHDCHVCGYTVPPDGPIDGVFLLRFPRETP